MKLEQQVVSLELAQKMKELGFKQESLFWYDDDNNICGTGALRGGQTYFPDVMEEYYRTNTISAYTVAELGEMLPDTIKRGNTYLHFRQMKIDSMKTHIVCYDSDDKKTKITSEDEFSKTADTEADARAKMLIYLAENKLLTP